MLAGCTLEPHYVRPQPAVTQQWPASPAGFEAAAQGPERSAAQIGWREFFTDAKLQTLIEQALQHNPDAQIASLNIAAARAQYQIQRASLFPKISASAVEQVQRFPTGVTPTAGSAGGTTTAAGSGLFRYFDVGVGFTSYELDLFGRIRSLNHARLQQYL